MTRIILSGGWGWRVARSSNKKSVRFTSVYLMKTERIKGGVVFREKFFLEFEKTFYLVNLLSPSIFIFNYREKDNFYQFYQNCNKELLIKQYTIYLFLFVLHSLFLIFLFLLRPASLRLFSPHKFIHSTGRRHSSFSFHVCSIAAQNSTRFSHFLKNCAF